MATYNGHQEDSEGNILLPTPHSYAPIELGTTASQAYTKGKLMVYNNRLCQAKTSISSGATLTIGTNIEYTDMDTQLNNVKVYVGGSDSKLHFVDHTGADTALNFNPIQTGGTYNATSRGSSLDMGQRNTYRYVNTNSVPNNNTTTKSITTRGSSIDLGGATHNVRYVDTTGIPNNEPWELTDWRWINSNPSSSFSAQQIDFPEGILIEEGTPWHSLVQVLYRNNTSSSSDVGNVVIDMTKNTQNQFALIETVNGVTYARQFVVDGNVEFYKFGNCQRLNSSGTSNSYLIPISVKLFQVYVGYIFSV